MGQLSRVARRLATTARTPRPRSWPDDAVWEDDLVTTSTVETPLGPGRLTTAEAARPRAVLLLGHGAGGGINTIDLEAVAQLLPARGITVVRYEQPWRVAGKKVAPRPASLDIGWQPALDAVADRHPGVPLVVGGRSAGARVACRCFAAPALGVVALSFPLHPPGHPEKSRVAELDSVVAPVLLVSGAADPFASPAELEEAAAGSPASRTVRIVPGSTHSFRDRRADERPASVQVADAVADFLERVLDTARPV